MAKRELANSCPKDVDELMEDVQRIGSSAERLRGCFLQSQLPFFALIRYIFMQRSIRHQSRVWRRL